MAAFRAGQIAIFRRHGGLVAHRVVRNPDSVLITRGDRLRCDDAPVLEEELVGRVVSVIRDGREIPVEFSLVCRAAAVVLRRSDFAVRVLLGLERRLRPGSSWTAEGVRARFRGLARSGEGAA